MKGEFPQSFILSLLIRDSIIALHFCNLLLQFLHLLLLQHFLYSIGTTWMNWSA